MAISNYWGGTCPPQCLWWLRPWKLVTLLLSRVCSLGVSCLPLFGLFPVIVSSPFIPFTCPVLIILFPRFVGPFKSPEFSPSHLSAVKCLFWFHVSTSVIKSLCLKILLVSVLLHPREHLTAMLLKHSACQSLIIIIEDSLKDVQGGHSLTFKNSTVFILINTYVVGSYQDVLCSDFFSPRVEHKCFEMMCHTLLFSRVVHHSELN